MNTGRVGTLIVPAYSAWGILTNFQQKCWLQSREVGKMLKNVGPRVGKFEQF